MSLWLPELQAFGCLVVGMHVSKTDTFSCLSFTCNIDSLFATMGNSFFCSSDVQLSFVVAEIWSLEKENNDSISSRFRPVREREVSPQTAGLAFIFTIVE